MKRLLDWFFRDRATGAIVIAQWPNLPLWLFGASAGLAWILEVAAPTMPAWAAAGLQAVAVASLAWWALDEVIRGVNPWRRCLGGFVFVFGLWRLAGRF